MAEKDKASEYYEKHITDLKNRELILRTAIEQAKKIWYDIYMSSDEYADLYPRLGYPTKEEPDEKTIPSTFPPFKHNLQASNLLYRIEGFRNINNKINELQNLLRLITGQVRTKITEWDITLYLQHGEEIPDRFISDDSLTYSLLLGLFEDAPLWGTINRKEFEGKSLLEINELLDEQKADDKGPDIDLRSLVWGNINASVSAFRERTWSPTADPDLQYWVPPTDSLSRTRKDILPTTKRVKKGWLWWSKKVTIEIPPRITLTPAIKKSFNLATTARWSSWTPKLWELFFEASDEEGDVNKKPPHPTGFGVNEIKNRMDKIQDKKKIRTKDTKKEAAQKLAGGASATGINVESPIFYGEPFGRLKDPRSLENLLKSPNRDYPNPFENEGFVSRSPSTMYSAFWNGWKSVILRKDFSSRSVRTSEYPSGYYSKPTRKRLTYNPNYSASSSTKSTPTAKYESFNELFSSPTRFWTDKEDYGSLRVQKPSNEYPWWMIFRNLSKLFGNNPKSELRWNYNLSKMPASLAAALAKILSITYFANSGTTATHYDEGGASQGTWNLGTLNKRGGVPILLTLQDYQGVAYTVEGVVKFKEEWKNRTVTRYFLGIPYKAQEQYSTVFLSVTVINSYPVPTTKDMSATSFEAGESDSYSLPNQKSDLVNILNKRSLRITGVFFEIPEALENEIGNQPAAFSDPTTIPTQRYAEMSDGTSSITISSDIQKQLAAAFCFANSTNNPSKYYSTWFLAYDVITDLKKIRDILNPITDVLKSVYPSPENLEPGKELDRLWRKLPKSTRKTKTPVKQAYKRLKALSSTTNSTINQIIKGFDTIDTASQQTREEFMDTLYNPIRDVSDNIIKKPTGFTDIKLVVSSIASLLQRDAVTKVLDDALTLLYEYRLELFKKRMNKEDGTLMNLARMELSITDILEPQLDAAKEELQAAIEDQDYFPVVHKVTTASKETFVQFKADTPEIESTFPGERERITKVFIQVNYDDDDGNVLEPPSAFYRLVSAEYVNLQLSPPLELFLQFDKDNQDESKPFIRENVMAGVDTARLSAVAGSSALNPLDAICAARKIEDWWEIRLPESKQPLTFYYEKSNGLLRIDALTELDLYGDFVGSELSPIIDENTGTINSPWQVSPEALEAEREKAAGVVNKVIADAKEGKTSPDEDPNVVKKPKLIETEGSSHKPYFEDID